jgi:putative ABC transport system permease protein
MLTLPGVDAVSATLGSRPMVHNSTESFWIEGRPKPANLNEMPQALFYLAEDGFQRAMGVRLERGRFITPQDDEHAPTVIVVDSVFAHTYFPNEDPIGKRILVTNGPDVWRQIVGVVSDIKQYGVDQKTTNQTYEPYAQYPFLSLNIVLRTTGSNSAVAGALRPAVYSVDKDQPIGTIQPLEEILGGTIAKQRFATVLLLVLSLIALVIAAVGIYGVMAYSVLQRRGEFGIRMALGAQRRDVLRLVLAHGGKLVGVGVVIGLVAMLATSRIIGSLLFQTSSHDPLTFGITTILLAAVALAACLFPARRATRVNPIEALRTE